MRPTLAASSPETARLDRGSEALRVEELDVVVGHVELFHNLSLSVRPGESVAVVGRSGVGKTTLVNCLLGLVKPSSGAIQIAGQDITRLPPRELARLRAREIGVVFQSGELMPELTALENCLVPAFVVGTPVEPALDRAGSFLSRLGVRAGTTAVHLSGGERQRVALARALMNSPALLLADEPTGSLDIETRDVVADILFETASAQRCALLVVTHDPEIADRADRTISISERAE